MTENLQRKPDIRLNPFGGGFQCHMGMLRGKLIVE